MSLPSAWPAAFKAVQPPRYAARERVARSAAWSRLGASVGESEAMLGEHGPIGEGCHRRNGGFAEMIAMLICMFARRVTQGKSSSFIATPFSPAFPFTLPLPPEPPFPIAPGTCSTVPILVTGLPR